MTHIEIDRQLALAIGYRPEDVKIQPNLGVWVRRHDEEYGFWWRPFHHTMPTVIWPIAARYNAFPYRASYCKEAVWYASVEGRMEESRADTPEKAVALAVIKGGAR